MVPGRIRRASREALLEHHEAGIFATCCSCRALGTRRDKLATRQKRRTINRSCSKAAHALGQGDEGRHPEESAITVFAAELRSMFRKLSKAERIDLAKSKIARVLDHFLYVLELHSNNSFVVYSNTLTSQIPQSYAANAFEVFQRSMHQIEIVRLCALWDSADSDKENIPTVIELIDDEEILDLLAHETRKYWGDSSSRILNTSDDPEIAAMVQEAVNRSNREFGNEQAAKAKIELQGSISHAREIIK
nr:hypothetical protein [Bradyrhizobium canariense]